MRIILTYFLLFSSLVAFGQEGRAVIRYEKSRVIENKDEIKMPQFRPVHYAEHFYSQYKLSKHKEKKLEKKVKITYDLDEAQKCKRLGKISTPDRILANLVKDKNDCEVSIRTLMNYADKKGGNMLYISVFPEDCKLGKFLSFAMKCK